MSKTISELKSEINILDVVESITPLKKKGSEYVGHCTVHQDTSASLSVNERKQVFLCGPCGVGGDVLKFLEFHYGIDTKEAYKKLLEFSNQPLVKQTGVVRMKRKPPEESVYRTILAPPQDVLINHYKYGEPSQIYPYTNDGGLVIGYSCRFDLPDNKKIILPYTYCLNTKTEVKSWRWIGFDNPKPLYGMEQRVELDKKSVMLVEGEKAADHGRVLFPHIHVMTWVGGTAQWMNADWNHLQDKNILLWPDKDSPGVEVMKKIETHLIKNEISKIIKWIPSPKWAQKKWDIADAEWSSDVAIKYVKTVMQDNHITEDQLKTVEKISKQPAKSPPKKEKTEHENFFLFLGFSKSDSGGQQFHFFIKHAKIVIRLTSSGMGKSNLITLAPFRFWENMFQQKSKGFDVDSAQNWIINMQNNVGPFNQENFRGRGAWMDNGRSVFHNGRHLIVDGVITKLGDFTSDFIYEASSSLGMTIDNPLSNKEASQLLSMMNLLNVGRGIDRYLLAGWCVIAPICGSLTWRPHIWLTGSAGTGKSWIMQNIIRELMKKSCVAVQSETTEAGIRQYLGYDARPIIFDEIEPNDRRSNDRVQNVLALSRAASHDDSGKLIKGSGTQQAHTFKIRSCFAFASIVVALQQHADITRVTVIDIIEPENKKVKKIRWEKLQKEHANLITDDFVNRLQARTIKLQPIIVKNAKVFSNAIASVLGTQRTGDQLGAMLAGAYSLRGSNVISYENAVAFIKEKDWSNEKYIESSKDEYSLLLFILEQIVKVESLDGLKERSIGELIAITFNWKSNDVVIGHTASEHLRRLGVICDIIDDQILISNKGFFLKKILKDTAWSTNHSKVLLRIDGADRVETSSFGGHKSRSVSLPLDIVRSAIDVFVDLNNNITDVVTDGSLTTDEDDDPFK